MEQRGNRFDSIRADALDVAVLLGAGPDTRDRVADALVKVCGGLIEAAAKSLAIGGESDMNDCRTWGEESFGDAHSAYTRYLAGERLQDGARESVKEVLDADLERYARDGLKPVWVPPTGAARTREQAASGDLSQRAQQAASKMLETSEAGPARLDLSTGQPTAEGALLFGPYTGPTGANGEAPQFQLDLGQRVRQAAHATGNVQPLRPHTWVPALDGDNRPMGYDHCGVCGQRKCSWLAGDAVPACDWDVDCPVHGDVIAQGCGSSAVATGLCDAQDCPAHGDAGRVGPCLRDTDTQPLRVLPLSQAPVAPDAARRSIHGNASAADVAAGRCDCGTRGGPCPPPQR